MSNPPPASRGVERERAAVADRRGPATEERARGRTSHSRARSPGCSAWRARRSDPSVGLAAERKFSSLQSIGIKRNRIGIRQIIPPRSEEADATAATVSPNQKGSRRCVHPGPRSREIGGLRNFPIRKPLKRIETAKESRCRSSRRLEPAFRITTCLIPPVSSRKVGPRPVRTRNDG
jgi:hypothetical protein